MLTVIVAYVHQVNINICRQIVRTYFESDYIGLGKGKG